MNPASLSKMASALGVTSAPLTLKNIGLVVEFFSRDLHIDLESDTFWQQYFPYLRGIDYHSPMKIEELAIGTELSRHEPPGGRPKPFTYYTKPGTSQFSTGTSFPTSTFKLYRVTARTRVLTSRASGINFSVQDRVSRNGGGLQYIVSSTAPIRLMRSQ